MREHSPQEMIKIIQRGIAGHMTFLAASSGWGTNSELALYPPIGTILQSRGWHTRCQFPVPRDEGARGPPCTIDFIARRNGTKLWELAMEIKLIGSNSTGRSLVVDGDYEKLAKFGDNNPVSASYLLIVGRKSDIEKRKIKIAGKTIHLADIPSIIADLGRTAWGSVAVKV